MYYVWDRTHTELLRKVRAMCDEVQGNYRRANEKFN
jgi:hypothetical protein